MEEGEVTSCGESKNGWVRLGWIGTRRSDKIAGPICNSSFWRKIARPVFN